MRAPDTAAPGAPLPSSAAAHYALGVLMLVTFTALLDRYLIGLVLEPIRHDFSITDTQASLLQGLAFAMLYSVLGLPFGRWVDRGNRRNIILFGVLCWSVMTMLCGAATSYPVLFLGRLGVGVGEACLAPAAYSFLTDSFPSHRHGRAIALFTMGSVIGGGGSFIFGAQALHLATWLSAAAGPLAGTAPWRITFLIVGAPGLFAALLMLSLREPARQGVSARSDVPSLGELGVFLCQNAGPLAALVMAGAFFTVSGTGAISWLAVFLSRTYGMPVTVGGGWIGLLVIGAALVGAPIAGALGDSRRTARMIGEKMNVAVLGAVIAIPFAVIFPMAASAKSALILFALYGTAYNVQACSLPVAMQDILPNRFKGQVTALYWLCVGLIGFGGGSTAVALVTQHVFGHDQDLRYAIAIVTPSGLALGAIVMLSARRSYQKVRDRLQTEKHAEAEPA